MTLCQSSPTSDAQQDAFRWEHIDTAGVHDDFSAPFDPPDSQRRYAREHGIPRSTLGYWLRKPDPDGLDPDLVAFFRSRCGLAFLRRLVLALFVAFHFRAPCGLRCLATFLQLTQLDRFVASSVGALHELAQTIQTDLGTFGDCERLRLAEGMPHRHIALVPDENFHGPHICLVAPEPASNFILVEQYADCRDEATWTAATKQGLTGLNVTVGLVPSDQAKALIACADHALEAQHLPELFHGQRPLCQALMGPLSRHKEAAVKQLQRAEEQLQSSREKALVASTKPQPGRPVDHAKHIGDAETLRQEGLKKVQECSARLEQARAAVRGIGDDYHPFDAQTGGSVQAEEIQKRLAARVPSLQEVAQEAELGSNAQEAVDKSKGWIEKLVAAMAWFWGVALVLVSELDLPDEAEQAVYEKLLPGLYWQQAAPRARTAEERIQKEELAKRLLSEAWAQGGALDRLTQEEHQEVKRVSNEVVGLFQRSSSCVEGPGGRLSLFHHGQTRLSTGKLKALTVIHNYHTTRADGTTAAQRFFGQKPRHLFTWLLERLPDLPRPAAKRPNRASQTTGKPG